MPTYPTLPTAYGADPTPLRGAIEIDRAEDGTARARSFWSADKVGLRVVHPFLTAAQKTSLDDFYAANRLTSFDYADPTDGVTRTLIFAGQPAYERHPRSYWTATVQMEEA